MNINVAKTAGFCFGVNRAVNIVDDLLNSGKSVCTLGPIIHNMEMVNELKDRGCLAIDSVEDCPTDSTLVIRSHGVAQSVIDKIESLGLEYIDATCPFVKKIHNIVEKAGLENKIILIAGNKNHPEVQGIVGHCKSDCYTFNNEDELLELENIILNKNNNPICVVAQTTFSKKEWKKCIPNLNRLLLIDDIYTTGSTIDNVAQCAKDAGVKKIYFITLSIGKGM